MNTNKNKLEMYRKRGAPMGDLDLHYEEMFSFTPQIIGDVSLSRVLYKKGNLLPHTEVSRARLDADCYFYELHKKINGERNLVMSDWPMERYSYEIILKDFCGDILIGGLGIGLFFKYIKNYKTIDIIEKDKNVINIVWPYYKNLPNVNIEHCDLLEYTPQKKYDFMIEDFLNPVAFWEKIDSIKKKELHEQFSKYVKNIRHWEL